MYKKGHGGVWVVIAIMVLIVIAFISLGIIYIGPGPTGDSTKSNLSNLIVTNSGDCLNQKDPFGPFNYADCSLNIRNLGTKPIELTPEFKCWKLSNPGDSKIIKVGKDAIPSGGTKTFSFSYNNGGREWSCQVHNFNAKF